MSGLDIFIFAVFGYFGFCTVILPKIFGESKKESTPEQEKQWEETCKKTDEWLKKINS